MRVVFRTSVRKKLSIYLLECFFIRKAFRAILNKSEKRIKIQYMYVSPSVLQTEYYNKLTFLKPLYILCSSALVNFVFDNNPSIPSLCSDEQLNEDSKEHSKQWRESSQWRNSYSHTKRFPFRGLFMTFENFLPSDIIPSLPWDFFLDFRPVEQRSSLKQDGTRMGLLDMVFHVLKVMLD